MRAAKCCFCVFLSQLLTQVSLAVFALYARHIYAHSIAFNGCSTFKFVNLTGFTMIGRYVAHIPDSRNFSFRHLCLVVTAQPACDWHALCVRAFQACTSRGRRVPKH
jgi:hypothetical protein